MWPFSAKCTETTESMAQCRILPPFLFPPSASSLFGAAITTTRTYDSSPLTLLSSEDTKDQTLFAAAFQYSRPVFFFSYPPSLSRSQRFDGCTRTIDCLQHWIKPYLTRQRASRFQGPLKLEFCTAPSSPTVVKSIQTFSSFFLLSVSSSDRIRIHGPVTRGLRMLCDVRALFNAVQPIQNSAARRMSRRVPYRTKSKIQA